MGPLIDLRSDTVTLPTPAMRQAIASAEVGDDVYGDDPSVNRLQAVVADRLGKEAALFVASGTQSNLLAILSQCERGDEYIAGQSAHTYRFEGGGAAVLGSVQPQPLPMSADGQLDLQQVVQAIKPVDPHFARTRLLCLENTHGGVVLPQAYVRAAKSVCDQHGLALHLDGARLFNAAIASNCSVAALAEPFDTVSVCLSKGLGAPVGSVLAGSKPLIERALRWRKVLGGGMRQAGVLAAAGLHALEHHVQRLAEDHANAARIATLVNRVDPGCAHAATNMVFIDLPEQRLLALKAQLAKDGVCIRGARWVFHLGISSEDMVLLEQVLATRLAESGSVASGSA
ncbi:MAG: low-specificity L-threonine aldolase [Pseudomonadales bacterium]